MAGIKCIIHTPHGHIFYGYFGPVKTRIFIWVERFTGLITTKIITLTRRGKEEHLRFKIATAEKFVPIYSGIDLPLEPSFASLQQRKNSKSSGDPDGAFVFGSVCRLDAIKGVLFD